MSAADLDLLSIIWPMIMIGLFYIAVAIGMMWISFEDLTTLENDHE